MTNAVRFLVCVHKLANGVILILTGGARDASWVPILYRSQAHELLADFSLVCFIPDLIMDSDLNVIFKVH